MSIKGQGHSLTLVKVHLDFKAKCMTVGLYTQVSDSGPLGPLVFFCFFVFFFFFFLVREGGGLWSYVHHTVDVKILCSDVVRPSGCPFIF